MPVIVFDRAACSLEARKPILADTSTYFHQLLCVMQHLHARGVWHRDIKPGNLLLAGTGPNGRLVLQLADLGISRVAHVPNGAQPTGIGTQPYMAPEQQDPSLAPGDGCWAKADVWSAGVALLEMVGGGWHEWVLAFLRVGATWHAAS
jgi:serine/threonine-protein kinase